MPTATADPQQMVRSLFRDPVRFSTGLLHDTLWPVQRDILTSVARNPLTAVKACHSSGKTYSNARAAIWWLNRYADGIVVTTAPTAVQLERQLWGEIQTLARHWDCPGWTINLTEIKIAPNNFAIAISTNEADRFQGWHGGHILAILDEAPGVKPFIWEALEGVRAGGEVHVLATGNPTIAGGPFYQAFTQQRSAWNCITISAFDTPNLAGLSLAQLLALPESELDHNPLPYLTRRRWVKEKYEQWGPDSPQWQSRVLGQFPKQATNAIFALAWLEEAQQAAPDPGGLCVAGIDVAGPGDDETALCLRCEDVILVQEAWSDPDPRGPVLAALLPYKERLKAVNIDADGLGYYFARHLKDAGFNVGEIHSGGRSSDKYRFTNLKDELYWGLRERLRLARVKNLQDRTAFGQLSGVTYSQTSLGQTKVESKDEIRKRGAESPDRGEAVIYAYADVPTTGSGFRQPGNREQRGFAQRGW